MPNFETHLINRLQSIDVLDERNPWLSELPAEICDGHTGGSASREHDGVVRRPIEQGHDRQNSICEGGRHNKLGSESVSNIASDIGYTHFIRNALYAFAHAIEAIRKDYCGVEATVPVCDSFAKFIRSTGFYPRFLAEIKAISFLGTILHKQLLRHTYGIARAAVCFCTSKLETFRHSS